MVIGFDILEEMMKVKEAYNVPKLDVLCNNRFMVCKIIGFLKISNKSVLIKLLNLKITKCKESGNSKNTRPNLLLIKNGILKYTFFFL